MKNKICLIILFCVVLITVCTTSFALIEKKNISKHNLVYASGIDNKLYETIYPNMMKNRFLLTDIRIIFLSENIPKGIIAVSQKMKIRLMLS